MDKLRLRFSKTGRAVYISHLDLMRTMQRVFSRAGLGLKYSEGFNPHAKISIVLPLSVGMASRCEFLDFALTEETDLRLLPEWLNRAMPEGIEALQAYQAEEKGVLLKWIRVEGTFADCQRGAAYYNDFFSRDEIVVARRTKRGTAEENIAPYIRHAAFADEPGRISCDLIVRAQEPSISPELLIAALGADAPGYHRFIRTQAYREDMTVFR
jgi:radical SAM-linked protein